MKCPSSAQLCEKKLYDMCVVGAGPGGYVAALHGRHLGLSVALVEADSLGGVCLNWGCIPTKFLLKTAEIAVHTKKKSAFLGLSPDNVIPNLDAVVKGSRDVVNSMGKGLSFLLKKNNIDVYAGWAAFSPDTKKEASLGTPITLKIYEKAPGGNQDRGAMQGQGAEGFLGKEPQEISTRCVVLATGSKARNVFSSLAWGPREAMSAHQKPASLLIVGAGAIGVEFASFYADMGTKVTLVERLGHILPLEDEDISVALEACLKKRAIEIYTGASVSDVQEDSQASLRDPQKGQGTKFARIITADGQEIAWQGDAVLCAIGVSANTENLGLEHTHITQHQGFILTHGKGCTQHPGIYAIGDVAGAPCLAHKASFEAIEAVTHISSLCAALRQGHGEQGPHHQHTFQTQSLWPFPSSKEAGVSGGAAVKPAKKGPWIPSCTYSSPQVASVGLGQAAAHEACSGGIFLGKASFEANGAASVQGNNEGFVKLIFCSLTRRLLGAHCIGPLASELITGLAIALNLEATDVDLRHMVFPHPTLSEVIGEAAWNAIGLEIHSVATS